jgi:transposase
MTNPSASPSSSDADVAGDTFQRIEVINGTGRRRNWSRRRKEAIVLETLEEGASVSEVARRHGVDFSQVFKWRRDAGLRSRPSTSEPMTFAPLLIEQKDALQPEQKDAPLPSGLIELELAGARARIPVTAGREVILAVIDGLSMRRR